jgi:hypothetical protein
MHTSTQGFDEIFLARLEQLLAERHPTLELEVPSSAASLYGPQPHFMVSNPRTGSRIGVDVRSGEQARYIPLVLLPKLRALRERLRSNGRDGSEVMLITTGSVPNLVRDGLDRDGIPILHVDSPEEAAERFGERLNAL